MIKIFKALNFSMKESRQVDGYYLSLVLPSEPTEPIQSNKGT
jgi:hypothetical protein